MKLYVVKIIDRKHPKNYIYNIVDKIQLDFLLASKKVIVEKVGVLNV